MSKAKKKVVTTKKVVTDKKPKPTVSKYSGKSKRSSSAEPVEMVYKKINYIYMGIGIVLILLGFILMSGGAMPDPSIWDEGIIYSARRITLAPILILAGLVMQIFAIFK